MDVFPSQVVEEDHQGCRKQHWCHQPKEQTAKTSVVVDVAVVVVAVVVVDVAVVVVDVVVDVVIWCHQPK